MPDKTPLSSQEFQQKLAKMESLMKAKKEGPDQLSSSLQARSCRLQGPLNQLAFDLFAQRLQEPVTGNAAISPVSIALALGMVLAGTVDRVESDIRATLHISTLPREEINHCFATLQQYLKGPGEAVKVAIANSLWVAQGRVTLLPNYQAVGRSTFDAEIAMLDFNDRKSLDTINGWVSNQTHGKIPSIISPGHLAQSILVLINALYFKGSWQAPFDPERTQNGGFTLADGTRINVPMMSRTGSYLVHDSPTMQAIRLPYGQEGRFGMVILLPGPEQSLADLVGTLNSRTWYALLAKMQARSVRLSLPRFTVEDEWNLVRALKALGMASAFSDPAGFRKMVDGPTVIGDAVHKVFMEVNEEGTEAAAVTGVMMSRSLPAPFVVDRPFVLAIHDEETGAILFLGQVTDPR